MAFVRVAPASLLIQMLLVAAPGELLGHLEHGARRGHRHDVHEARVAVDIPEAAQQEFRDRVAILTHRRR
jgi:hypothetical protein